MVGVVVVTGAPRVRQEEVGVGVRVGGTERKRHRNSETTGTTGTTGTVEGKDSEMEARVARVEIGGARAGVRAEARTEARAGVGAIGTPHVLETGAAHSQAVSYS